MSMAPPEQSDENVLRDIETFWRHVDAIAIDLDKVTLLPHSVFESDRKAVPPYLMAGNCLSLVQSALDHLHALRWLMGNPPNGFGRLLNQAPWTMLRSSLQLSSHAIWIAAPDDQQIRIERLLRTDYEDRRQKSESDVLLARPRDKEKARELATAWEAGFDEIALPWEMDEKAHRRIRQSVSLSECVHDAAEITGVTHGNIAQLYWKLASAYAHGKSWPQRNTTRTRSYQDAQGVTYEGQVMEPRSFIYLQIMSIDTINYAIWLLQTRCGYESVQPTLVATISVPQYVALPKP